MFINLQFEGLIPFGRKCMRPDAGGPDVARGQAAQTVALLAPVTTLEAQPEAVLTAFVLRGAR